MKPGFLPNVCAALAVAFYSATAAGGTAESWPVRLRPALYGALAEDIGPAYVIGRSGCARVPGLTPGRSLRGCFDAIGAHFGADDRPRLSLRLVSWGRSGGRRRITAAAPVIAGNGVSYRHGGLVEWWRALPIGFEQGFTLARRAAGNGELTLELAASADAQELAGNLAFGRLRYGELVVCDAVGRHVPAVLKHEGAHILIVIDDVGARYPLTVDPLVWLEQQVKANDGDAFDNFGWSVAVSGNSALVGAYAAAVGGNAYQGAAYVFTESNGVWSETQKLTAGDGAANDQFGFSVALDGTSALVGAPNAAVDGNIAQGAAYVFTESGGVWGEAQKLTATDGAAYDHFGRSIALDGTNALVGANGATVGGNLSQGAAYVFTGSDGVWNESQKLTANDGAANDQFGRSIALDGTNALVGALNAVIGGNAYQGAAYLFADSGGVWSESQKLVATDGAAGDLFGNAVALDGETALVGAPLATIGANASQGAAYVFTDAGGSWSQTQKLTAGDGGAGDQFGTSTAVSGGGALVGAEQVIADGPGAAYVFTDTGGSWTETQKLSADDGEANDFFGGSVAFSGTTVLVGAPQPSGGSTGRAYFYGESDLALTVNAPGTVARNRTYLDEAVATNAASAASPAVVMTIAVPAAASFISATFTQGSCGVLSDQVDCDLGPIAGGGTATVALTLKATGEVGATLINSARIAQSLPSLTASAPTVIEESNCHEGYAEYDGTLAADAYVIPPDSHPYHAPAGEEDGILTGPEGFRLFLVFRNSRYGRRIIGAGDDGEIHRETPAGWFAWVVKAGAVGGDFVFCLKHP